MGSITDHYIGSVYRLRNYFMGSEKMNPKEKEELETIMGAMICMTFTEEINNICMNIDMIEMRLKTMVKSQGIPIIDEHEFLDIILEAIPTIYKMNNRKPKEIISTLEKLVDKMEDSSERNNEQRTTD